MHHLSVWRFAVYISPLVVKELKRIVESSEIVKFVHECVVFARVNVNTILREDDTNWPKKNIVGKQEIEIRIGSDHIAFEASSPPI